MALPAYWALNMAINPHSCLNRDRYHPVYILQRLSERQMHHGILLKYLAILKVSPRHLVTTERADEWDMIYFAFRASPKICLHITSNILHQLFRIDAHCFQSHLDNNHLVIKYLLRYCKRYINIHAHGCTCALVAPISDVWIKDTQSYIVLTTSILTYTYHQQNSPDPRKLS